MSKCNYCRIEFNYVYWDGTSHKRTLRVKKGNSIGTFIESARKQLIDEFPDLKTTSFESLLLVKDDMILPHV